MEERETEERGKVKSEMEGRIWRVEKLERDGGVGMDGREGLRK
jgi:hypothetical protein